MSSIRHSLTLRISDDASNCAAGNLQKTISLLVRCCHAYQKLKSAQRTAFAACIITAVMLAKYSRYVKERVQCCATHVHKHRTVNKGEEGHVSYSPGATHHIMIKVIQDSDSYQYHAMKSNVYRRGGSHIRCRACIRHDAIDGTFGFFCDTAHHLHATNSR